ncbi:MAG: SMP-30/gluconolactonase/LRE family protein [Candidatus Competibacteraceae bacterium]|nr:SMP-30/gluconolactonase/LRE family protein [Candidatus Competibacteraceae bacterium]MCB1815731.1 SMP-30/gluconolactonase/LRE family protein [Candidatus Competibacteraceae bacterium]
MPEKIPKINTVIDTPSRIGECPVWSAEEQALYWVDILEPAIHRLEFATGARTHWRMPSAIGSFGLREQGGAVVALRTGFHLFDFATGSLQFLLDPEAEQTENRFNDGKVSPDGRFFAGTMHDVPDRQPVAALYRLDPDGSCHKVLDHLHVSNGLAWSPDGKILYHSDSRAAIIQAFDYDSTSGAISKPRLLATVANETGRPDGAATDVEGYYWSAGVSAGVLNRWSPDGKLAAQIPMPCTAPTMPCFGGPDMKTLFVTSLTDGQPAAALAAKPLSGCLFSLDVDVPGVPIARFKG